MDICLELYVAADNTVTVRQQCMSCFTKRGAFFIFFVSVNNFFVSGNLNVRFLFQFFRFREIAINKISRNLILVLYGIRFAR